MFREQPDVLERTFSYPTSMDGEEERHCVIRIFHIKSRQPIVVMQFRNESRVPPCSPVEDIVNMVVHRYDLDPGQVIWLEYHGWDRDCLYHPNRSQWARIFLDWHRGEARHPSRALIDQKDAREYIRRDRKRIPGFARATVNGA